MSDEQRQRSTTEAAVDPAERIAQHLLRTPSDLIDTRRLMRRFQASVDDFLRALKRLEDLTLPKEEKATC
jgi:hypothetical protein